MFKKKNIYNIWVTLFVGADVVANVCEGSASSNLVMCVVWSVLNAGLCLEYDHAFLINGFWIDIPIVFDSL